MTFNEIMLLLGLLVAGGLIAFGCFMIAPPLCFIVGGVMLAAITLFMTIEVGE